MSAASLLDLSSEFNLQKHSLSERQIQSAKDLADLVKLRAETISDFNKGMCFFYHAPVQYNEKGVKKYFSHDSVEKLKAIIEIFEKERDFNPENTEISVRNLADELEISAAKLIHPLRLALTGDIASPGIFDVVNILGKSEVNKRIEKAIEFIKDLKIETK